MGAEASAVAFESAAATGRLPEAKQESERMPGRPATAGLLLGAVVLAACENVPLYNQSLDWFSRSRYDPQVRAIEERTPPPQDSPVLTAPSGAGAMAPTAGGPMLAAASPLTTMAPPAVPGAGGPVSTGPRGSDGREITSATLPPRPRITPPMGFARSKRVIYGTNRGPFQVGNVRTLR